MRFDILDFLAMEKDLKTSLKILGLLQKLRDDFQLLDEKISIGDITDVKELIQIIENNLNELKEYFNSF